MGSSLSNLRWSRVMVKLCKHIACVLFRFSVEVVQTQCGLVRGHWMLRAVSAVTRREVASTLSQESTLSHLRLRPRIGERKGVRSPRSHRYSFHVSDGWFKCVYFKLFRTAWKRIGERPTCRRFHPIESSQGTKGTFLYFLLYLRIWRIIARALVVFPWEATIPR